jgi:uncharacterized protein YcbX
VDICRLTDLYVHPLESAAGIRLERAALQACGIPGDRRWVLVDSSGGSLGADQRPVTIRGRRCDPGRPSLDALNARRTSAVGQPVPMTRFRPNLVVDRAPPFADDSWRRPLVGDDAIERRVVRPCARCSIVPVDQATGIRGREPLPTLATDRKRDGKVYFGQNILHGSRGGHVVRVAE